MYNFPISTEFNKRIPKQKIYENADISPALRRIFTDRIRHISWRNKLAAATLNIAAGEVVTEVEIIELRLSEPQIDEDALRLFDKAIPYHILFILTCDGKAQAWIGYKQAAAGSSAFKVSRYYHTEWMDEDALTFRTDGANMDDVYESLLRQIALMQGEAWSAELGAAENIALDEKKKLLEKRIAELERKMRNEKQLNRRMEMNSEIKKLKEMMQQYG